MKVKNSIIGILLSYATLYCADVPQIQKIGLDIDTGAQIPVDSYYSAKNLEKLNKEGIQKHAPLAIIINENDEETPDDPLSYFLTKSFADILKTAFVPTIVSR